MSIEERVRKVVSEQLDVSGEIDNNASFIDDLGADSLDTVELVMSLEEEFDTEPEPSVEEKPSLTQTILDAISETDDDSPPAEPPSDESETPDFAEVAKPSRGPPGGGRLIREGAPEKPAQGPPTRGPPGIESETPSEEDEEADLPTLTPVLRPVLQPATRTVLTPIDEEDESEEDEVTVLKPIGRAVLKPVASPSTDEEE